MTDNVLIIRRYRLTYFEVKCYETCNLLSNGSEKKKKKERERQEV